MAEFTHNFSGDARQPGLNSFVVHTSAPAECIVHEVLDDGSAPHLRAGDFAIVDPTDCEPLSGELFLVEWKSRRGARRVVEIKACEGLFRSPGESKASLRNSWGMEWRQPVYDLNGAVDRVQRWFDGPYNEAGARDRIVGRVVGILAPDFRLALAPVGQGRDA
ncbi:hypothetical protein [Novosphingobium cyanobacteriorum]|uniref:Uncharacterized protein n=1 Tax=Novosphingobium cyanobacteriorum TaxID=3024215 RepID=A0ABT6CJP3_9SPHN|nr:hypothetical protein [Novosphingobium cyanobacteriorum]MDF8334138.1 hypothetical protein [Novosphingobium cyanobacteriorum]